MKIKTLVEILLKMDDKLEETVPELNHMIKLAGDEEVKKWEAKYDKGRFQIVKIF